VATVLPAAFPWIALGQSEPIPVAAGAVEHMVPMRDGVKLATNVFLPEGEGPWPMILTRTPYGKDGRFGNGWQRYTSAGYAYAVQDCRGKFRSEGEYRPFEEDGADGFDTVNWAAAQPWCNGKVGMTGASAMGITATLAAIANPDPLVCAFVVVAPQSFFEEATFIGGVFKEADVGNWMRNQGAGDQVPERRAGVIVGRREIENDIVRHRHKIDIPIYNLGGWYDIFSVGTVGNFSFLHNHGAPGARGRQKLLVGPFGHGRLEGDLAYPGGLDLFSVFGAEELRWFDHWLKGKENGLAEEPPVKFYMMASARNGAVSANNGWRTLQNWPPAAADTRYYLHADRGLKPSPPNGAHDPTAYAFDPADPVPTVGGANLTLPIGPMDQRAIGERPDYLRFQTPPLESEVAIAGPVRLELFVSTDAPDTDVMAKLVDVYPDGYVALVLDAPLRLRYRHGREPDKIKMMTPGKVERVEIHLWQTAVTFETGHRIALHVTSSNAPRFEVNPNTGEAPNATALPPRVAQVSIHHDAARPSALVLPVLKD